ncbi:MAG: hypothetical protein UW75_C0056G0006 [Parcubacteria group bacterium GW2011_GWF2_44_8]|nr:MAG: hypothetical protein UW75_C0056G0006 [Parcubacteria group bacterium GW2011_GWF2_44_8]
MLELRVESALLVTHNNNVATYFRLFFGEGMPIVRRPSLLKAMLYLRQHGDADTIYIDYADFHAEVLKRARNVLRSHHPTLSVVFVARTMHVHKDILTIGDLFYTIPERITA